MPRPTDRPRLATLSPAAIGRDAAQRVLRRLTRLVTQDALSGVTVTVGPTTDEAADTSGIARTVADLVRFAQTGTTADWGHWSSAGDAIHAAGEALLARPLDLESTGPADLLAAIAGEEALDDPLLLGLVAARARWSVLRGEPVSARDLAALASVTPRAIRDLRDREEIRGWRGDRLPAGRAAAWLATRGVPGFSLETWGGEKK